MSTGGVYRAGTLLAYSDNLIAGGQGGGGPLILDLIPGAAAAYSFRKLRTAYAGKAMQVTRASDSAVQDIGFAGNDFDTAAFTAFIGASSGTITTWYDQSGNGYDLTVSGSAPTVNLTSINGHPAGVFVTGNGLAHVTTPALPQPFTISAVAERTGTFTAFNGIVGDPSAAYGLYFNSAANGVALYAGSNVPVAACSDSVAHSVAALFNDASSAFTVDGSNTVASATPGTSGFNGLKLGTFGSASGLTGNMSEAIAWGSALSAGNNATLYANQKAYWGTP